MNVLIMTDKLITGGAENYFCKLENELTHPEITFHYAAAPGELLEKLSNKKRLISFRRKNHISNIWKLRKKIVDNKIDIIHANSLRMVLYALTLQMLTKRRFYIFYTKHNVTALELKFPSLFAWLLNRGVERVLTVSEYEKRVLIKHGVNNETIKTIYNGVDLEQFKFHTKKQKRVWKIGILARISEEKNHEFFLQIAKECRNNRNLLFFIAGEGPDFQKIKDKIEVLDLVDKVQMLGAVSNPENFIREMDVLLLTSNREVFPMVILEAMAAGTPVITIDRGGIKEAVHDGKTGFLISDHSASAFTSKITDLMQQDLLRKRMLNQAREKVEKEFSLQQMIKGTLEEYIRIDIENKRKASKTVEQKVKHVIKRYRGV